jgi:chromosome condensin MukBEF MukE localization factor
MFSAFPSCLEPRFRFNANPQTSDNPKEAAGRDGSATRQSSDQSENAEYDEIEGNDVIQ